VIAEVRTVGPSLRTAIFVSIGDGIACPDAMRPEPMAAKTVATISLFRFIRLFRVTAVITGTAKSPD
jgi:hypothetical protein